MSDTRQPRFIPNQIHPTLEQLTIQLTQAPIVVVSANAGAAKTTTLALRIAEALARGMAPSSVLALTFTEEARDVLRSYLLRIGVSAALLRQLRVYTVDEFAWQCLAKHEEAPVPLITDYAALQPYMLAAVEQVSERYGHRYEYLDIRTHALAIGELLREQQRLKAMMALEDEEWGLDAEDRAVAANTSLTAYLCAQEYEAIRQNAYEDAFFRGPFDATYDLARLLVEDSYWRTQMPHYGLVVVDELHDMNEATFQVLCALLDQPNSYFVGAGDKDQVLHSESGASERFLYERFRERFPSVRSLSLTQTYRHGPHLAYMAEHFKQKVVRSEVVHRTRIRELSYASDAEVGARCVEVLQSLMSQRQSLQHSAILLRDRHQSVVVEEALSQAGIRYVTSGFTPYLARPEVQFLVALMALATGDMAALVDDVQKRSVVAALSFFAELDYPADVLNSIQDEIVATPDALSYFWSGRVLREARPQVAVVLEAALAYLTTHRADAADAVLTHVVSLVDWKGLARRLLLDEQQAVVMHRSIQAFIQTAARQGGDVSQFYQYLCGQTRQRATGQATASVVIERVANTKGKEYDHVILPYLEKGEYPLNEQYTPEEDNLFYVAITRARMSLTLLVPSHKPVSNFVARLGIQQVRGRADEALALLQSRMQATLPITAAPAPVVERTDLAVSYHEREEVKQLGGRWDPVKRVWYVPANIDPAPFKQWFLRS